MGFPLPWETARTCWRDGDWYVVDLDFYFEFVGVMPVMPVVSVRFRKIR